MRRASPPRVAPAQMSSCWRLWALSSCRSSEAAIDWSTPSSSGSRVRLALRSVEQRPGYLAIFGFRPVKGVLLSLLDDPHLDVRQEAVEALVRAGGAVHVSKLLATSSQAISYFVEMLEYESNDLVALETLERFADHPDPDVQATVRRVALVLQPDFRASGSARRRPDALATTRA